MIYYVNHRYREKIIVPLIAIERNVSFLCDKDDDDKCIQTSDNVLCGITDIKVSNILDLENEISTIYKMGAYEYLKIWRGAYNNLDSLSFVVLKLKKKNDYENR